MEKRASNMRSLVRRVGKHYPTHLHSRDASYPEFRTDEPDPSLLCGALVSGPYAPGKTGEDGPVVKGAAPSLILGSWWSFSGSAWW